MVRFRVKSANYCESYGPFFNFIFCKMPACGWGWPWAGASVSYWHISSLLLFEFLEHLPYHAYPKCSDSQSKQCNPVSDFSYRKSLIKTIHFRGRFISFGGVGGLSWTPHLTQNFIFMKNFRWIWDTILPLNISHRLLYLIFLFKSYLTT